MPDLDTLIQRAARQGAHPDRLRAAREQLAEQMYRNELANLRMSIAALLLALVGLAGAGAVGWLLIWSFHTGLSQFASFPHAGFWMTYGVVILLLGLVVALVRPRTVTDLGGERLAGLFLGLGLLGAATWLALWAYYSGMDRNAPFPHGTYWVTYTALVVTLAIGASILRPRSMYGTKRGPFSIADDPLWWRDGPLNEWENFLRFVFALPNLLRMSLYNLLSVGHLRRVRDNGELALFVLLAADKRIVAEEILLVQKKKRPAELWSVIAALARLEFLRYERLRGELVIWRGQAAEQMLGIPTQ